MRLGWLINPETRSVEIYRPGRDTEILNEPQTVSGEDILPGFEFDASAIWESI